MREQAVIFLRVFVPLMLMWNLAQMCTAPIPKTRVTTEEMIGRWEWKSPNGCTWYVWLERDGSYRSAMNPTASIFLWIGRWYVNDAGTGIVIIEWLTSRDDEADPKRHLRHELPRSALSGKVELEGSRD